MKKRKHLLFLLLGFSILFFSQCDPDKPILPGTGGGVSDLPPPTDTFYVDQELKSYYFFPQGSWWVYKMLDTNVLIYDTAIIAYVDNELKYSRILPFAWEAAGVVIEHSHYPSPPGFVSPHLSVGIGNSDATLDRISMTSQGKLFPNLRYFFSVPIDSTSMANKTPGLIKTTLIDTNAFHFNNNTINNVVHLRFGSPDFEDEIWMAKNIGLLKYYNAEDQTTWELINYHIN